MHILFFLEERFQGGNVLSFYIVFFPEPFDSSCCINEFLLSSKERVARGAYLHVCDRNG